MQRSVQPSKTRAWFGPRSSGQWFALPAVLLLGIFLLYPFLYVVRFWTWVLSGLSAPKPIGLDNYRQILQDPDFWKSLSTTLIFALMSLPPFILLSVLLALALEEQPYERQIKALLFLPGLVTLGGAAVAWYTLFSPEYGALAAIVAVTRWDQNVFWALVLVVLFTLWRNIGYGVLVVSARLKAIPKALQ